MKKGTLIYPRKLNGSFWGITTFFNPSGYKNKIRNYKKFRRYSKKQGLRLLTVELAFEDRPFELKDGDADIIIQIRGKDNNVMWQKEALLNIGLKNLPHDCDKICWLDCDIIFEDKNWIKETSRLLEQYKAVQPYYQCFRLFQGFEDSFLRYYLARLFFEEKQRGIASKVFNEGPEILDEEKKYHGETGFAFALRKEVLQEAGFYDKDVIVGTGDNLMVFACYGKTDKLNKFVKVKKADQDLIDWSNRIFDKVRGSVCYSRGNILHLWHGYILERNDYEKRKSLLVKSKFNQLKDIRKNKDGIWEWASDKSKLHKQMHEFFLSRNEDRESLSGKERRRGLLSLFIFRFVSIADRNIGKVGLIIKKITPGFYFLLKGLEKNQISSFLRSKMYKGYKKVKKKKGVRK
jgi:hypothetical protein